jgi:hypothetical protein
VRALVIGLFVVVISPAFAAPAVEAHISAADVTEICQLVSGVTSEKILVIHRVTTSENLPGAIPIEGGRLTPQGFVPTPTYERTDRVYVHTGSRDRITGNSYVLQKTHGKWRILSKGSWIR